MNSSSRIEQFTREWDRNQLIRRRNSVDTKRATHAIDFTENAVYPCGVATEASLVIAGVLPRQPIEVLRRFRSYDWLRERVYHALSNDCDLVSKVFGRNPPVSAHVPEEDVSPERAVEVRE